MRGDKSTSEAFEALDRIEVGDLYYFDNQTGEGTFASDVAAIRARLRRLEAETARLRLETKHIRMTGRVPCVCGKSVGPIGRFNYRCRECP